MSFEEIKHLLDSQRIAPNKILGQNFLIEPMFYPKLCNYAELGASDVVLDAGAGFGFLARFVSGKCKAVVAVEKDPQVVKVLRAQVEGLLNVEVIEGDVLRTPLPSFNKVIALPPYYLSSNLVVWLLECKIDCAVLVLQKEFAQRLVAPIGSENYSWLTVVASQAAAVELFDLVPKDMFHPQPDVDSIITRIKPHWKQTFQVRDHKSFIRLTKWLFTERNKKLAKAIAPFLRSDFKLSKQEAEQMAHSMPFHEKRARELTPKEFGEIANALPN